MKECLYWIESDNFCAGIIVSREKVVRAAPILYWMMGKHIRYIETYCQKKKWIFKKVEIK